jgi:chemotaxis protein MotB
MGKWLLALVVLLAVAIGALYYWLYRPQQAALSAAQERNGVQDQELRQLRGRVADLETIRNELQSASATLQKQVADRESELARVRTTQDDLVSELQKEILDKRVEVDRMRDQLRVEMVDEVLFDSGEAQIKPAGMAVLKRIGGVLKNAGEREIEVQGHTDNVPIRGALTQRFATNWELSAARALNVVRFLQDQAGMAPERLTARAYGEHRPRVPNDSEEGRRKNRRIEILIGPTLPSASVAPASAQKAAEAPSPKP